MTREEYSNPDLAKNAAYQYGVARQMLSKQGYPAEMFVTYELQLAMTAEWWKQLFGESEGKEGKGILPTSATSLQIYTHLDNLSKKEQKFYMKQF